MGFVRPGTGCQLDENIFARANECSAYANRTGGNNGNHERDVDLDKRAAEPNDLQYQTFHNERRALFDHRQQCHDGRYEYNLRRQFRSERRNILLRCVSGEWLWRKSQNFNAVTLQSPLCLIHIDFAFNAFESDLRG